MSERRGGATIPAVDWIKCQHAKHAHQSRDVLMHGRSEASIIVE
jgi:hypothetical protein